MKPIYDVLKVVILIDLYNNLDGKYSTNDNNNVFSFCVALTSTLTKHFSLFENRYK